MVKVSSRVTLAVLVCKRAPFHSTASLGHLLPMSTWYALILSFPPLKACSSNIIRCIPHPPCPETSYQHHAISIHVTVCVTPSPFLTATSAGPSSPHPAPNPQVLQPLGLAGAALLQQSATNNSFGETSTLTPRQEIQLQSAYTAAVHSFLLDYTTFFFYDLKKP